MSISKIKALAVALTFAAFANAQFYAPSNARMDALSGAPFSDITGVFSYPVLMTGYTDHLQATWGGGIIGVKAVSDVLSVGIAANQGLMLGRFYDFAADAIDDDLYGVNYNIPHLLLGFDLGTVRIGAGVFFEYARSTEAFEVGDFKEYDRYMIMHPGVRLSTEIDLGDIGLLAKIGMGFPYFGYRNEETDDSGRETTNYESDGALFLEVGAEVSLPLFGADWIIGGEFATNSYK